MDHPLLVRVVQGAGDLGAQAADLAPVHGARLRELGEGLSAQVLEGDVENAARGVAPHVVDDHDPGMAEPRGDARFLEKARLESLLVAEGSGQDGLQGDVSGEGGVAGLVDHAHGSAAQLAQDLVAADRGDGVRSGWAGHDFRASVEVAAARDFDCRTTGRANFLPSSLV